MKNLLKLFLFVPAICLISCQTKTASDISQYQKLLKDLRDNSDAHSELYIFPDEINTDNNIDFRYKYTEDLFNGSYLFYLVQEYSEDEFNQELDRLSKIQSHFNNGLTKSIIHDEEKAAFISIYRNNNYEYAYYFKDSLKIAYTFNQLYPWSSININYPLASANIPNDIDDGNNSYNMYYFYTSDVGYYVEDTIPNK